MLVPDAVPITLPLKRTAIIVPSFLITYLVRDSRHIEGRLGRGTRPELAKASMSMIFAEVR